MLFMGVSLGSAARIMAVGASNTWFTSTKYKSSRANGSCSSSTGSPSLQLLMKQSICRGQGLWFTSARFYKREVHIMPPERQLQQLAGLSKLTAPDESKCCLWSK